MPVFILQTMHIGMWVQGLSQVHFRAMPASCFRTLQLLPIPPNKSIGTFSQIILQQLCVHHHAQLYKHGL